MVFFERTFQNLDSSLAITSSNLFDLMLLLPIKLIEETFVFSPRLISINKSTFFSSTCLILDSTLAKLYPKDEYNFLLFQYLSANKL